LLNHAAVMLSRVSALQNETADATKLPTVRLEQAKHFMLPASIIHHASIDLLANIAEMMSIPLAVL